MSLPSHEGCTPANVTIQEAISPGLSFLWIMLIRYRDYRRPGVLAVGGRARSDGVKVLGEFRRVWGSTLGSVRRSSTRTVRYPAEQPGSLCYTVVGLVNIMH